MDRKPGKERHSVPYEMTADEGRIAEQIREAFSGVTLGDGVGLYEGQALDDYESPKHARQQDEKSDWSLIPTSELNRCHSSLSFFDAEGMRFHLPAFLIADLKRVFHNDVISHLTSRDDHSRRKFALLNAEQRAAVREFLVLHATETEESPNFKRIDWSLRKYWKEPASG